MVMLCCLLGLLHTNKYEMKLRRWGMLDSGYHADHTGHNLGFNNEHHPNLIVDYSLQ